MRFSQLPGGVASLKDLAAGEAGGLRPKTRLPGGAAVLEEAGAGQGCPTHLGLGGVPSSPLRTLAMEDVAGDGKGGGAACPATMNPFAQGNADLVAAGEEAVEETGDAAASTGESPFEMQPGEASEASGPNGNVPQKAAEASSLRRQVGISLEQPNVTEPSASSLRRHEGKSPSA